MFPIYSFRGFDCFLSSWFRFFIFFLTNHNLLLQLLWCWKLPISAFSQRWGFNNFIWILQERVIVAFFHRLHRSRLRNLHFCGLWLWRYVSVQCLLSVVFLALWFVNFFLTLNFKASIIYRFFSLSVTCGIFALWFSLNQMFVIKFSDQVERTTAPSLRFFTCCLQGKLSGESAIVTSGRKKPSGHGSYKPHFRDYRFWTWSLIGVRI